MIAYQQLKIGQKINAINFDHSQDVTQQLRNLLTLSLIDVLNKAILKIAKFGFFIDNNNLFGPEK